MSFFFHVLQWIVSLIGVAAFCYLMYWVVRAIATTLWSERGPKVALALFVACGLLAATAQRLRIGFWDWPDVEYEVENTDEDQPAE